LRGGGAKKVREIEARRTCYARCCGTREGRREVKKWGQTGESVEEGGRPKRRRAEKGAIKSGQDQGKLLKNRKTSPAPGKKKEHQAFPY